MQMNHNKSNLLVSEVQDDVVVEFDLILPYTRQSIYVGIKYLRFELKPNYYLFEDLMWLINKIQPRVSIWTNRWLLGRCYGILSHMDLDQGHNREVPFKYSSQPLIGQSIGNNYL
jgi:hypothetical protein